MIDETPAVVVVSPTGVVSEQNMPARRLLGAGVGRLCWDMMRELPGAQEQLPCRRGCVGKLASSGFEHARHTRFSSSGRLYHLTCVPQGAKVICTLALQISEVPESSQLLTPRETDVLRLIAQGETNAAVADYLGLSRSTVRTHIEHMFAKLETKNRAALVGRALQLGLLD